jgi:2-amino-4-hydroxy-6-hydroxymethyldihydropteridine diphosphokinase
MKQQRIRKVIEVYIALGSNLDDPVAQLTNAVKELAEIEQVTLKKVSRYFKSPPVGMQNQPDFINAVAKIETTLGAEELLQALFAIENAHHRIRKEKNGPRTLDLDLLLYGNQIMETDILQIPHPRMKERSFVIVPLAEIEPELILPCGSGVASLLQGFVESPLQSIYVIK